jgi:hypothetical protein
MTKHECGNVFLYLLIGIALFASLTFVITRSQNTAETNVLGQAQVETSAQRLIGYMNEASQTYLQMKNTGTSLAEIDLVLPSAGGFTAGSHIHKLFHPEGGGLTYNAMNEATFRASATTPVGWKFVKVNADWTATSGTDLVMTYIRVKQPICAEINRRITGSTTIPTVTVNFTNTFEAGSTALQETQCAECKTYPAICVQNTGVYAFYNLIDVR